MISLENIKNKKSRLGVIGLGYVGLPLAIEFKKLGFEVKGFDVDLKKIESLNKGISYIEHIEDEDISELNSRHEFATSNFKELSEVEIIFVCVPTPIDKNRNPFMGHLEDTAKSISSNLKSGHLILIESSTYPGTTNELIKPILEESGLKCHEDFFLAYSPEREDPGNKSFKIDNIPKVVGADNKQSLDFASGIYSLLTTVHKMDSTYEAEAVKLTENIFRSVNIALVNELKIIFDQMDIDIWNVVDGASTKPFGYMPFYPGPGIGGHCIPVDPFYLTYKAKQYSIPTKFIELAGDINASMPSYIIQNCKDLLNTNEIRLDSAKVLVLGVAYKKDIDDMRESPSIEIMNLLVENGAKVEFYDPLIEKIPELRKFPDFCNLSRIELNQKSIVGFDIVLICTDHSEVDYQLLIDNSKLIIDTRNCLPKDAYNERIIKA
tara:strand:- start:266 stop:1573 length:1308 start_codon:yes stop_codon:yes gene_type:complete